ncbi:MAG: glycosyltransferase family 4 protein [Pseudomonadota bacterium]
MHFAFCIFKYFPYGGIQRDMLKMASACLEKGHQITVFTLRWEAPAPELPIEVVELPIEGINRHSQYENFAEGVRNETASRQFDLVLGFNKMPGLDVYYAGDPCYKQKALEQRPWYYRLLPRYRSLQRAEEAVFSHSSATRILTLSDVDTPVFKHHYRTQSERFYPLPPGIEPDRIAPEEAERTAIRKALLKDFQLRDDSLVVLFIGSGFIKKGLDRALIAVASLPDEIAERTHLFVMGRDKAEVFERMSMRLGISERVTFFSQGRDDVPRFLAAADGLLHPAYDETAGMVLLESILAGTPVLVTKNCGYAHYVANFDAGIVVPADVTQDQINDAALDLLTSPQRGHWISNGIAAKHDESLFSLVPTVVGLLERFAGVRAPLIAFVVANYFPYGGLQRDFLRIAQAFQSAGYRILVYTMSWQGDQPEDFEIIEMAPTANTNHNRMVQFSSMVSEHVRWRQAVCVFGFNKMPGLDIYYTADSCFEYKASDLRNPMYRRSERYRVMAAMEQAVFDAQASTQILFIAAGQVDQFSKFYGFSKDRTHVLPPGVTQDRMRPADWQARREKTRKALGLVQGEFAILMVGSGFVTKGLDRALEAIASLPDDLRSQTRFFVVGQDNARRFQRQAKALGIGSRVEFLGGRDDVPDLLLAADTMVHPAKMESGGLVLIEAVIAGLPVITTAVCGFASYVEDAQAGEVLPEPFNQVRLNDLVGRVLSDPQQRRLWSENGVRFGHEHPDIFDMPGHVVNIVEQHLLAKQTG